MRLCFYPVCRCGGVCPLSKNGKSEYEVLLATNVRWGAPLATLISLLFVFIYAGGDYPRIMVFVNVVSSILNLAVVAVVFSGRMHWSLGHVLTFTTYNSMLGAAVYSGGIASSSLVWLVLVPLVSVLMMGRRGGVFWGIISMATGIAFYIWRVPLDRAALIPVTATDRLIDLLAALLAVTAAVWISETTRYRALRQLETTRSQLQRLATIDPLTQVYNRRYFDDHAIRILRASGEAAFLTFDIDHFKSVNDRYGHETGDRVLQIVCQRVLHHLREADILARFGGEEFVILLPDTDTETALAIAERLRREVCQEPFHIGDVDLRVTISIGIAPYMGSVQDRHALGRLLRRADQAMYCAKKNGRNRVELFSELEETPT